MNLTNQITDLNIRRPLLRYHGGKWLLARWIISHFPLNHKIYIEPFGGAASVLLQKWPCYAEIYNDLDGEIVNLFRVLRNHGDDFEHALMLTPYSRDEFNLSYETTSDDFERARRTVVRSFMGFSSTLTIDQKTGFRSNSNRSGTTPAHDWKTYSLALKAIINRLRGVVIENRDAKKVMASSDSRESLHYVDPPYLLDTRHKGQRTKSYRYELKNDDHVELCEFLKTLCGVVILSGYENEIYNDILKDWQKITKKTHADGAKPRTEVLWINKTIGQLNIFNE